MPLYIYVCSGCEAQSSHHHAIGEDGPRECDDCGVTGSLYRDFNQGFNIVKKTETGAARERINNAIADIRQGLAETKEKMLK